MRIIGIDPSLNRLGYFIFDSENMKIVDYGYIPNEGEEQEKLLRIYKILTVVLDTYKPDVASIEEEFFSRNVATLKTLSHVHGAILLLLSQRKISYTYYSVLTLKSQLLNGMKTKKDDGTKKNGKEMKIEVANKVFEIFGRQNFIKDFTDDVTDAASAAYCYYKLDGKSIKDMKKENKKPTTKNIK